MNDTCFFASDLHGRTGRYEKLFAAIVAERPAIVFLGGDILPSHGFISDQIHENFLDDFLGAELRRLKAQLKSDYPAIFVILGNDDPRSEEPLVLELERQQLWTYIHDRQVNHGSYSIHGYAFVPPTPFRLKDWEKYDVSQYADPGCIGPLDGTRTFAVAESELKYGTIQKDLSRFAAGLNLSKSIVLFHTPPYQTNLDRAALDGKQIDHAPLDVHVGSIAVRRFIQSRQPKLTLHGHIHESARITGSWRDQIGSTQLFSAAHDGPELALVRFQLNDLQSATRQLL